MGDDKKKRKQKPQDRDYSKLHQKPTRHEKTYGVVDYNKPRPRDTDGWTFLAVFIIILVLILAWDGHMKANPCAHGRQVYAACLIKRADQREATRLAMVRAEAIETASVLAKSDDEAAD